MPGWAQLFVAAIALLTLALSGAAIYVRYGRTGFLLTCLGVAYLVAHALLEGVGIALLNRAFDRLARRRRPPDR